MRRQMARIMQMARLKLLDHIKQGPNTAKPLGSPSRVTGDGVLEDGRAIKMEVGTTPAREEGTSPRPGRPSVGLAASTYSGRCYRCRHFGLLCEPTAFMFRYVLRCVSLVRIALSAAIWTAHREQDVDFSVDEANDPTDDDMHREQDGNIVEEDEQECFQQICKTLRDEFKQRLQIEARRARIGS